MTKTIGSLGLLALLAAGALAAPATHTVVKGDHLWGLAGTYYQNHFRWQAIYAANKDKIKDPNLIYPGQALTIPDLPSPAVGELPAQPMPEKASAPVTPAPEEAAAAPPPAAPAPSPAPAPEPAPAKTDDLSARMPEGQAGMYPSMTTVDVAADWKEDGTITEFRGREFMAAAGDRVLGRLEQPAEPGAQFEVYRQAAAQELDADPNARHLQRVGVIKVEESLGKNLYRFLIVKSVDSVEAGDLLKKRS